MPKLVAKNAVAYIQPVMSRKEFNPDGTPKILWTQMKLTDRGGTVTINDGGWDLSKIPEGVPCDFELEVQFEPSGFAQTVKLDKRVPFVVHPSGKAQ